MSGFDPSPASTVLAMDIGGSHVSTAAVTIEDGRASLRAGAALELDSRGSRDDILSTLIGAAAGISVADALWSIAIPGPFDYEHGSGTFRDIGKFEAIAGVDLRGILARALVTSPECILFINDAVAYGIGEWAFGTARRPDRMVCVTLGTGVGSAFLDAGRPVREGASVPCDGEVHTIELDGAPLEETVSSAAIQRSYELISGSKTTVNMICARARAQEVAALTVVTEAMTALGRGLAPWIERFGASTVVVGGAISQSWDVLEGPLRRGLADMSAGRESEIVLQPSTLLERAPLLGAAEWARCSSP